MNLSELKKNICETYHYKIELHAHTSPVSRCSEIAPELMADIYASKGYDGIVITNHFSFVEFDVYKTDKESYIDMHIEAFEKTKEACEKYGIKAFLGTELRFSGDNNDYLIYGVDRKILSTCFDYFQKEIEIFRKEVELPDSVFIQAHPFRNGITQADPQILDGVEIFNMHPGHNSRIGIATRFAYENNVGIKICGSDFHHLDKGHEAVSALRVSAMPSDSFELAALLKSGDYCMEIGENTILLA